MRVLVVEDERKVAEALRQGLEGEGLSLRRDGLRARMGISFAL